MGAGIVRPKKDEGNITSYWSAVSFVEKFLVVVDQCMKHVKQYHKDLIN